MTKLPIYLYNTLSHKKEIFQPKDEKNVGIYVCGPTVYDRPHIGNVRSAVAFDVLYRFLSAIYPKVTYVRNVTDVDDKINNRARELNCSIRELTEKTLQYYHDDLDSLHVKRPTLEPRATEHIQHMLAIIAQLIKNGHAYEAEHHVLFDVSSYPNYGHLSRKNQEDLIAGARVEIAPYKKNPSDFVLWKPSDDNTPGWDSPYGYGRPGWHIECSAMSAAYLGDMFDIHAGGIDLTFPHHENEIAQSCCANHTPYMAKYWMHNGHLTVNGSKMSKSEGNFITAHTLLERYDGEILRLALLSSHYRQPLDWTDDLAHQAKSNLDRFYGALALVEIKDHETTCDKIPHEILQLLSEDLNVPGAISYLHSLANNIYKTPNKEDAIKLRSAAGIIGLLNKEPDEWFKSITSNAPLTSHEIEKLIVERNHAKVIKDFKKADSIRDELFVKGYQLLDTPNGTTWRLR